MEDGFEKYLKANRGEFEKDTPSPRVWQKLEDGLILHHQRKAKIIKMRRIGWSVAATLLLFAGAGLLWFKNSEQPNSIKTGPVLVVTKPAMKTDSQKIIKDMQEAAHIKHLQKEDPYQLTTEEYSESIYYYTRLVELRQKQIMRLQRADPDIYKESKQAIDNLDADYDLLKKQLPNSIDREKVLESMIQNLQLQEKILNNQLQLIREMQNIKNNGNEKSAKEI